MLEKIYAELAKLIAKDIHDAAKNTPEIVAAIKSKRIPKISGSEVPQSVLKLFDVRFVNAISSASGRGSAKWRANNSEVSFEFYFTSDIAAAVLGGDWAEAALRTGQGAGHVAAFGGREEYNKLIATIVPHLVRRAIETCIGKYNRRTDTWGWEVIAGSRSTPIAHRGTTDFVPREIFYMERGTKEEISQKYKSAKRLLHPRWFGWSDPPAPFEGPYLR